MRDGFSCARHSTSGECDMSDFGQVVAAPERPVRRHRAALQRRGRAEAARLGADRAYARPPRRAEAVGAAARATSRCARSARSPATRRCRWSAPASRRSISPAGRSRPTRTSPARCIPTSRSIPANSGPELAQQDQQDAAARRPDRASGRRRQARLVRADRRRCRSRLRRAAQLLRDHEGLYRGGRRGRSLRGPARVARRSAAISAARC